MKVGVCSVSRKYAQIFDVLEVQKTFYDEVSQEELKRWRGYSDKVEYTIKALQVITHTYNSNFAKMKRFKLEDKANAGGFKLNKDTERALEVTLEEAKVLGSRIIVFQTPPSFAPTRENVENIRQFFSVIDRNFIYGWEPRGEWYANVDLLLEVLRDIKVIHVVDPFRHNPIYGEVKYFRLHGIGRGEVNYKYDYTDEDLYKLKEKVDEKSYVLFNNVYSVKNALRFKEITS
ncbi:MAG: hypothetical protein ASUL_01380 [Candidatus Aramenus sulfurataquae]|jgi:uncharacterized protein YecE (DUF72 family)|uniref:DUF72 domain-containing protein n=2 Tax=Candidatus Aramenus sulfurataquae TaxID=1326980 RepID=W7KQ70_9CREN|nr:MAG: hypothetical protein ASUL_01380 [Candidatus Aramenus sulfurataquae]MCL7344313.1 DUF72 domain-containing protein [Candidatus Aramenus sulfurataquae]